MTELGELARSLRDRLLDSARENDARPPTDAASLRERVIELVDEQAAPLNATERTRLVDSVIAGTVGLGRLEPLMDAAEIDEIMINGPNSVMVERHGRIEPAQVAFESEEELMHVIERILSPIGRRVDEASPLADARLPDGSRVNCVIPPLSLNGPLLTIRRFRRRGFTAADLVACETITEDLRELLEACVRARLNVVVSGGTGCGKTTLLNVLSSFVGEHERVITIEDAAELRLAQFHVLRLESRPPNLEGSGEITIRQLVRNALRMRPDRIIVGEVRGAEALDMLQALNTGHDGSMTTVHANSAADALRRIETLALMAELGLPHGAVREQLASALDVVVHLVRDRDGGRRVTELVEVLRFAGEVGVRQVYRCDGKASSWVASFDDVLRSRLAGCGWAR
ncbi:MAG: CpaF family protein [Solirubrobacterales bacterium]